jgi:hypothetical protein
MDTDILSRRIVGNIRFEYGDEQMTGLGRWVVRSDVTVRKWGK